MYNQLLIEAFVVGIGFSIIGLLINYIKNKKNKNILDNESLIQIFFISGFLFHFFCEISGINKWYCKNGNACH